MERGRFPNKLKAFRRCNGYSRKKVARLLGYADNSTLSRWERGVSLPGTEQVFRLARMYRTLPHELFDELWIQVDSEHGLVAPHEPFTTNHSSQYE